MSQVTSLGKSYQPDVRFVWGVFLRLLAASFFIAAWSLQHDCLGMLGSNGVLPIADLISTIDSSPLYSVEGKGLDGAQKYLDFPSLLWFDSSDHAIMSLLYGTMGAAVLAFFGVLSKVMFPLMFIFYGSLLPLGGNYTFFIPDFLLLEACGLALFLPALETFGLRTKSAPHPLLTFAYTWFVARFMFAMGMEKFWDNDDPHWYDAAYMPKFYESEQPMPTFMARYMFWLPQWVHQHSCVMTFLVEIVSPLLFFSGGSCRAFNAVVQIGFQVVIMLSGNFGYFNTLTMVLTLPLFDPCWQFWRPRKDPVSTVIGRKPVRRGSDFRGYYSSEAKKHVGKGGSRWSFGFMLMVAYVLLTSGLGACYLYRTFEPDGIPYLGNVRWLYEESTPSAIPLVVRRTMRYLFPFHLSHQYGGIFRDTFDWHGHVGLVIQGSRDGTEWKDYLFKYNIQDVNAAPYYVPHLPRFDYQMFYEANGLTHGYYNPGNPFYPLPLTWFLKVLERLFEGNSDVMSLFKHSPFPPEEPPMYLRALTFVYNFRPLDATAESAEIGSVWSRRYVGYHLGEVCANLDDGECRFKNCMALSKYFQSYEYPVEACHHCDITSLSSFTLNPCMSAARELGVTHATLERLHEQLKNLTGENREKLLREQYRLEKIYRDQYESFSMAHPVRTRMENGHETRQ